MGNNITRKREVMLHSNPHQLRLYLRQDTQAYPTKVHSSVAVENPSQENNEKRNMI